MKSALVTDKTTAFLRYKDWADANYNWMRENSLEKFNGDKTARAKAFEAFVKEQMKNFSLSGLEEAYKPEG